jgi:hypothetical protein
MLPTLKGALSLHLLAAKSNHTVSRASLLLAVALSVFIACLAGIFAFAQWRIAGNLMHFQQQRSAEIAQRVGDVADMATMQANVHRSTLNVLLSRDTSEFTEADNQRRTNLADYATRTAKVSALAEISNSADALRGMTAQYAEISDYIIDLFKQGRMEEALDLRFTRLRPVYNKWQRAQENFSRRVAGEDRRQQEIHAGAVRATKLWLGALFLAPLALIALGTLAIAAILGLQRLTETATDMWTR